MSETVESVIAKRLERLGERLPRKCAQAILAALDANGFIVVPKKTEVEAFVAAVKVLEDCGWQVNLTNPLAAHSGETPK